MDAEGLGPVPTVNSLKTPKALVSPLLLDTGGVNTSVKDDKPDWKGDTGKSKMSEGETKGRARQLILTGPQHF